MKKLAIFLTLTGAVVLGAMESPPGSLIEAYRGGRIILRPDPSFAPGTDWGALFQNKFLFLKAAPDGTIFVSDNRDHRVLKFDASGRLILKFGRHGQGPGDFHYPGFLSILDDTTLVVGEYTTNRRISLFDLDGAFRAVLKTRYPAFRPTALRNGKIAYIGRSAGPGRQDAGMFLPTDVHRVIIIDAATGVEKEVESFTSSLNEIRDGAVVIARSGGGDLLVGATTSPEIRIYDPEGRRKGTVKLNIDRVPVTKAVAEAYQVKVAMIRDGKRTSLAYPMGEFLPYFADFSVDTEGHILVFTLSGNPKADPLVFQAYASSGALIGAVEIDRGDFDFLPDRRNSRLEFTPRGIFGILPLNDDEMETPRLFRVNLAPQEPTAVSALTMTRPDSAPMALK
jgi:hypothetical protein